MDDLISRAEAIDAPEKFIKDCNPDHFVGHQKFIEYMDNAEIGSFGKWQFANGFNMGLTAAEVAIKKLPSAQPEPEEFEWCEGCKEHDQTAHCCHRWTKVIRRTVAELKQSHWIPCSERLPNHDECIKNNGLFNVSDGDRSYSEWYDNDKRRFGEPTMSGFRADYAVIAWMPLPERYEVEE